MSADGKGGLQINIMGREFRVACPEEEQKGLLEAVDYLNRKMHEIRDNGKGFPNSTADDCNADIL